MRFKYIKLVDYNRFPLRDAKVFEHHFTAKLTMLSAPNGAGKSSLLKELSPLPSDKSYFGKDGYKELHIEKGLQQYILICDFRSGSKFSFICDGEELNKAGLVTTQRELAYQHFAITPAIHELLVGGDSFTTMSVINRKKLFSSITHLNIDKVLEGYNKLKDELKSNKLILKTQMTTYQSEEEKLCDVEGLEATKRNLEATRANIDTLLTIRGEVLRYGAHSASEDSLARLSNYATKAKAAISRNHILLNAYPVAQIPDYLASKNNELSLVDYKLQEVYRQLEAKQKELKVAELTDISNKQRLQEELDSLVRHVKTTKDSLRIFTDVDGFTERTELALYRLETGLPEILTELATNEDMDGQRLYTTDKYNKLIELKRQQVEEYQRLSALEISLKQASLEHSQLSGNVVCPACEHSWPVKEAIAALTHNEAELEKVHQRQLTLRGQMGSTERAIEEFTTYFTCYRQLMACKKDTEAELGCFWVHVYNKNLVFGDPMSISLQLSVLALDLALIKQIKETQFRIAQLTQKLNEINAAVSFNLTQVKEQLTYLDQRAHKLQQQRNGIQEQISTITNVKTLYEKLGKLDEALSVERRGVEDFARDYLVKSLLSVIDDELRVSKINLIGMEKIIHQVDTVKYTLERYAKDIELTQENIKLLTLAVDELCPKGGLIARSVSSFLNTIIYNINTTISRIWDYKMVLKPIDVENESLNYKFKLEIEDRLTVADISLASGGMQDMINLCFKMVLYRLLGLDGYPFYTDEFGLKLDSSHRSKVFALIFGMINSTQYSQIFMVTHIDVGIANFKDVEVLEL